MLNAHAYHRRNAEKKTKWRRHPLGLTLELTRRLINSPTPRVIESEGNLYLEDAAIVLVCGDGTIDFTIPLLSPARAPLYMRLVPQALFFFLVS